jgi:CRP/FNR family cyclic AMP-dependent transcriptional regulator
MVQSVSYRPGAPAAVRSLAALAALSALRGLPPEDKAAAALIARPRVWPGGRALWRRGEPATGLVLVTAGRVRLGMASPGGGALILRHAGPGRTIGEGGLLSGTHPDDADAIGEVRGLTFVREGILRLAAERPAIARLLMNTLADRLNAALDQMEAIAFCSIEARLARLFLRLARAEGAAALAPDLTQTELAGLIAASRPRVNQALARLQASGALRRTGAGFACDVPRLEALAGG